MVIFCKAGDFADFVTSRGEAEEEAEAGWYFCGVWGKGGGCRRRSKKNGEEVGMAGRGKVKGEKIGRKRGSETHERGRVE